MLDNRSKVIMLTDLTSMKLVEEIEGNYKQDIKYIFVFNQVDKMIM